MGATLINVTLVLDSLAYLGRKPAHACTDRLSVERLVRQLLATGRSNNQHS